MEYFIYASLIMLNRKEYQEYQAIFVPFADTVGVGTFVVVFVDVFGGIGAIFVGETVVFVAVGLIGVTFVVGRVVFVEDGAIGVTFVAVLVDVGAVGAVTVGVVLVVFFGEVGATGVTFVAGWVVLVGAGAVTVGAVNVVFFGEVGATGVTFVVGMVVLVDVGAVVAVPEVALTVGAGFLGALLTFCTTLTVIGVGLATGTGLTAVLVVNPLLVAVGATTGLAVIG